MKCHSCICRAYLFKKCIAYELRDYTPLIQAKFTTITYSHNTIRYQGSKLSNNLPNKVRMTNGLLSFQNGT